MHLREESELPAMGVDPCRAAPIVHPRDQVMCRYSCLRAKNGHLFWNSYNQSVKSIVLELFEKLCGKVPLVGDLTVDHRIGDL